MAAKGNTHKSWLVIIASGRNEPEQIQKASDRPSPSMRLRDRGPRPIPHEALELHRQRRCRNNRHRGTFDDYSAAVGHRFIPLLTNSAVSIITIIIIIIIRSMAVNPPLSLEPLSLFSLFTAIKWKAMKFARTLQRR